MISGPEPGLPLDLSPNPAIAANSARKIAATGESTGLCHRRADLGQAGSEGGITGRGWQEVTVHPLARLRERGWERAGDSTAYPLSLALSP